MINKLD